MSLDATDEEIQRTYKRGIEIIAKLMALNDVQLKSTIKSVHSLLSAPSLEQLFGTAGGVRREILNEVPHQINIFFYDQVEINPFNISFKPEHGDRQVLVEFNEHFKLEIHE